MNRRLPAAWPGRAWLGGIAAASCLVAWHAGAAEPTFEEHWQDGQAELTGYRYEIVRYGERRTGDAVMVFVTEPWSDSQRVKVDDPWARPAETFEALKLNFVRDFVTGIYDYNTMVSVFTRSRDFSPVEISLSSAEWCGHVYAKLRFDPGTIREDVFSYFEGETGSRALHAPPGGVTEEQLFILLRGLRGEYLSPGAARPVPFLPGLLASRLTHRPLEWTQAVISRDATPVQPVETPVGRFLALVYTVAIEGGRQGRFWIEADHPHRVLKWHWAAGGSGQEEAAEAGEILGTLRQPYWERNGLGDERLRGQLGLAPRKR